MWPKKDYFFSQEPLYTHIASPKFFKPFFVEMKTVFGFWRRNILKYEKNLIFKTQKSQEQCPWLLIFNLPINPLKSKL